VTELGHHDDDMEELLFATLREVQEHNNDLFPHRKMDMGMPDMEC
jgi:hypothetical protein